MANFYEKIFELIPGKYTNQKSYYGKAKIIDSETEKSLLSYETIVCGLTEGRRFIKYWNGYSQTTMKHINSFRELYGFKPLSKKQWEDIPQYKYIIEL